MTKDAKWGQINQQGSGSKPSSTDNAVDRETKQAVDNADNCSQLHQAANEAADRSGK
jgi:hypothetical protein